MGQQNNRSKLILISIGHFLSDFYGNFLPAILPAVIARQGLSLTLSGLLVMVYAVTSNMLQPVLDIILTVKAVHS